MFLKQIWEDINADIGEMAMSVKEISIGISSHSQGQGQIPLFGP